MKRLFRYVREAEANGSIAFLKKIYGEGIYNTNEEAYKPGMLHQKLLDREARLNFYHNKNSWDSMKRANVPKPKPVRNPNIRYNEDTGQPTVGFNVNNVDKK